MSTDVYTRISEKMKNEHFTEDEIKIVGKAKEQLSSYTTGGSVIGGLSGLMLARAKNFKGLQAMAIATGGFLIGSQMGLIMGAMSSVRTIQSIPNFQRVMHIVQEVREEDARSGTTDGSVQHDRAATMPSAGHQRFPVQQRRPSELMSDDAVAEQSHEFQGFKDGDGYHGGNDPNVSARSEQSGAWSQASQRAKELQGNSASWGQIRQQALPRSAWSDVRDGRHPSRDSKDDNDESKTNHDHPTSSSGQGAKTLTDEKKPAASGWDRVRQGGDANGFAPNGSSPDGPSDFARTREDLESRPSRQRNRYGDTL